MAFIATVGPFYVTAMSGHRAATVSRVRPHDGMTATEYASGETVRGSKRNGVPSAAIQRRAMALADATGSEISMARGEHYAATYNGTGSRSWSVAPASHLKHATRPEALAAYRETGWDVTVSELDGIIGYRHTHTWFRTFPEAVAFLAYHFPRPTETVADDATVEAVNGVFLDGFGETDGDLSAGDPVWIGITDLDGEWYGREQNDYGQHVTYRFAGERQAREWFDAIGATLGA